ncbi:hypothetical protein E2C01_043960 [Portunus trituberculatus]|uniref:Uncharacterized protein n=1 Tax=Portunus trituberculatus TaxID=210409 RepID=A0A5B7FZ37_PORTR|nr:hypothetical protein [Portunus trituberculatus]
MRRKGERGCMVRPRQLGIRDKCGLARKAKGPSGRGMPAAKRTTERHLKKNALTNVVVVVSSCSRTQVPSRNTQ